MKTIVGRNLAILVWLILCGSVTSLSATPTLITSSPGVVTGITGFTVNGIDYTVDFINATYADVFGNSLPTFLNDYSGTTAAAEQMATLFNAASITGIFYGEGHIFPFAILLYGFQPSPYPDFPEYTLVGMNTHMTNRIPKVWTQTDLYVNAPEFFVPYATFTPEPIHTPEISSLILCSLGFGVVLAYGPKLRRRLTLSRSAL